MTREELIEALASLRDERAAREPSAALLERAFPDDARPSFARPMTRAAAGALAAGALVAPFLRPSEADRAWSQEAERIGQAFIQGAARGGLLAPPSPNPSETGDG